MRRNLYLRLRLNAGGVFVKNYIKERFWNSTGNFWEHWMVYNTNNKRRLAV